MELSSHRLVLAWLPLLFAGAVVAVPPAHPMITPAPDPNNRVVERNLDPGSYINSIIDGFGSGVSSYIASGVPQFFQDFPSGEAVESSLGISDSDLAATPTQVLNVP